MTDTLYGVWHSLPLPLDVLYNNIIVLFLLEDHPFFGSLFRLRGLFLCYIVVVAGVITAVGGRFLYTC